jgi:endonuclease V-like protein UPF0215 family
LNRIVGVIFRGGYWLDGILTHSARKSDKQFIANLATTIRRSKHYSQIHAAIFAKESVLPNGRSDFRLLAEKVDIPVLVLRSSKGRSVSKWSPNADVPTVNALLAIGCAAGMSIPEAVRVADLIAAQI